MDWRDFLVRWYLDYDFKTFFNSLASVAITVLFALYNGLLGFLYDSSWNGSICVYYILLILIRGMMLLAERKAEEDNMQKDGKADRLRTRAYLVGSILLLILNLCMIGPLVVLVKQLKHVTMTLIPALAMAAYSFYKITVSSINLVKRKKSANCLVKLLRSINFVDALMSIVILQNTLIMVASEGTTKKMIPLTAVSSGVIWVGVVILSVSGFVKGVREMISFKRKDRDYEQEE